ncbi:MAG: hypothetical protein IKZ98_08750 [Clostridia bacterium]|nr:hypothetical protein [Clostridia bacterium]
MSEMDPRWYNEDGTEFKRIIRIFAIILGVVAVIFGYSAWLSARHVPQLPGEVSLNGKMSIQTMNGKLQEAGYIPRGEIERDGRNSYQYYESSEAFGRKTVGSKVGRVDNRYVFLIHYFQDTSKDNNADNPGAVYKALQEELTGIIGKEPVEGNGELTHWDLHGKTEVGLFYANDGIVAVVYMYKT